MGKTTNNGALEKSFCSTAPGGLAETRLHYFRNLEQFFTFNNSLLLFFDVTKGQAFGLLRFVEEPGVGCNTPTSSRPLGDECRPANHHQINNLLLMSSFCNQYFSDRQNCSVKGLLLPNQTGNDTNIAAE